MTTISLNDKITIIEKKREHRPLDRRGRANSAPRRTKSADYQTDDDISFYPSEIKLGVVAIEPPGKEEKGKKNTIELPKRDRAKRKLSYQGSKSDTETKSKIRKNKSSLQKTGTMFDDGPILDRDTIEQTTSRESVSNFIDFSNKEILYQIPKLRRLFTPAAARKRGIFSAYVVFADKGNYASISAGTIRDLIEWCSFFPGSSSTRNVLLYYRTLYSPEYLLNSILETFNAYERLSLSTLSQDILERFYALIVQWIIYWFPRDFDDQLRRALIQFLGQKISPFNNGQALHHIHYLLRNDNRIPNHRFGACPVVIPGVVGQTLTNDTKRKIPKLLSPRSFASIPVLSPRGKSERTPSSSLYDEFKSYSIASYVQFITVLESSLYENIELEEFLDKHWQKESKDNLSPNLNVLSDHFNKMSLWVGSVILSTSSLRKQVKIMRRFIRIARKLMKIRNYSSTSQIISGLNNISVARIKAIKNGLSENYLHILENLEEKFHPRDNYKYYRKLPKESPCLPFLPVYLRDLSVIFDTTPTFTDKENRVISLEKINAVGSIIYNDICIHNKTLTSYNFVVPEVHMEYFKTMLDSALDEDSLYQRSLILQPMNSNSSSSNLNFVYTNSCNNVNSLINQDSDNVNNFNNILRDIMNDNSSSSSCSSSNSGGGGNNNLTTSSSNSSIVVCEVDSHLDSLT